MNDLVAVQAALDASAYWPKWDSTWWHVTLRFEQGRLSGGTMFDLTATTDLSSFSLDFVLPVKSVHVDGRRRHRGRGRIAGPS